MASEAIKMALIGNMPIDSKVMEAIQLTCLFLIALVAAGLKGPCPLVCFCLSLSTPFTIHEQQQMNSKGVLYSKL